MTSVRTRCREKVGIQETKLVQDSNMDTLSSDDDSIIAGDENEDNRLTSIPTNSPGNYGRNRQSRGGTQEKTPLALEQCRVG